RRRVRRIHRARRDTRAAAASHSARPARAAESTADRRTAGRNPPGSTRSPTADRWSGRARRAPACGRSHRNGRTRPSPMDAAPRRGRRTRRWRTRRRRRRTPPDGSSRRIIPVKLSIIIPVYNEEQTISAIVERVLAVDLGDIESEVIVADDGSSDGTKDAMAASPWINDPRVRIYANRINVGKGCAIRLGLSYATADVILIQDAD